MKVSHRLYLTAVPAILGVLVVAALGYWGQYARTVPEVLLAIAAIATVGTLILSWINVRYVAQRVERLAGVQGLETALEGLKGAANTTSQAQDAHRRDELDAIEHVVTRLSGAVREAESSAALREKKFEERARDYARMLAAVAENATQRLEEVRLPLHILLENHFGDLNENQEEMLGAARTAAETADADLVALRQIAEFDLGTRTLRRDRVFPGDLVQALLPTLNAVAEQHLAALQTDIEALVAPIWTDQSQLQDAIATLMGTALGTVKSGTVAHLELKSSPSGAVVELTGSLSFAHNIRTALAARIIEAAGGASEVDAQRVTIRLPAPATQSK